MLAALMPAATAQQQQHQASSSLTPAQGELALAALAADDGEPSCQCWTQNDAAMVFYNRVPKCGSTTMLNYIQNASRSRSTFAFHQSNDYDSDHFHPDRDTRKRILTEMVAQAAQQERTVFERHIHYLPFADLDDLGDPKPIYINLLRDPGTLRASSFYFARDCICDQRPGYTDENKIWELQDEWCKDEWKRKSDALCKSDINTCYEDMDKCRELFPTTALGGTVMVDFLCGTDEVCTPELTPGKLQRAKDNLRDEYLWVGVLENMEDSLHLLQTLLPGFFGGIAAC